MSRSQQEPWRPANRGTAWKETDKGGLYLDFTPTRITALRPLPVRAWDKAAADARWRGRRDPVVEVSALAIDVARHAGEPPLEKGAPASFRRRRRESFRRFLGALPPLVADLLSGGMTGGSFAFLRLVVGSERARMCAKGGELALVFALAQAGHLREGKPPRLVPLAERWLRAPRKDILAALGFPRREACARVLSRVTPDALSPSALFSLRLALGDAEVAKPLFHVAAITPALVSALSAHVVPVVTSALLHELAALEGARHAPRVASDLHTVITLSERLGRALPRIRSLAELRARRDDLLSRFATSAIGARPMPFPSPPATLTPDERRFLVYLRDSHALAREGDEMAHCLGTQPDDFLSASRGDLAVWSLRRPPRHTLALRRSSSGMWGVKDVRRTSNAPPTQRALAIAFALAERANGNLSAMPVLDPVDPDAVVPWGYDHDEDDDEGGADAGDLPF